MNNLGLNMKCWKNPSSLTSKCEPVQCPKEIMNGVLEISEQSGIEQV